MAVVLIYKASASGVAYGKFKVPINQTFPMPRFDVVLLRGVPGVDSLQLQLGVPLEVCSPVKVSRQIRRGHRSLKSLEGA